MSSSLIARPPGTVARPATTRKVAPAMVGLAALLIAGILGGCESDELDTAMGAPGPSPTSVPVRCAKDAKPVALPASFPSSAAVPSAFIVTGVEARSGGRTVVTAVSPRPFAQTLADMQKAYTTRGWISSQGEVEERDAESNFAGNGLRGRWAIREMPECTDNTSVSLLIGK